MERQPGRLHIAQERHFPLVVVGGGLAGTCAAIAAARHGVPVALVQERPMLGGNSSSEIRVEPVGASHMGYHRDARETGIMEELFLEVRARSFGLRQLNGQHYPLWDVILAEKAEAEPNLTLFLNTCVVGVETASAQADGYATHVDAVLAVQLGTEQTMRLRCDYLVDATGDGTVAVQAGAPFRYGREARAEFGEDRAPEDADHLVLGSSIMFSARDVGRPIPFVPPAWAHVFANEDALPLRDHEVLTSGYWWIEWGGRLHTITENDAIRRELQAAVFGVWDHIKNRCTIPGVRERAATWTIDWIGHTPGKRESRRFEGDDILTGNDLLRGLAAVPADVVAHGGWPIDLHPPDGVYSREQPCDAPPLPGLYGIPLRTLYSRTVDNLFLAGRDISVSHIAFGSTRVMKTCAAVGMASGTAAALCIQQHQSPRALATDPDAVYRLQQRLLRDGAYLPLVRNTDADDVAQQAGVVVTATSEAVLRLDQEPGTPPAWEIAGVIVEDIGTIHKRPVPRDVPLDAPVVQVLMLSADHLDRVTLHVRSCADTSQRACLRIRQGAHLRAVGARSGEGEDLAQVEARVPVEGGAVTFVPTRPIQVDPRRPTIFILDPVPGVSWTLSQEEPPGTQAGRWDDALGYWRWLHGTLLIDVAPESTPFSPANVLSGVTRPERGANLWISDPAQPLPQALTLTWPQPVTMGRVEVTFDSGLSGWIWEGTFPMIVRDYQIETSCGKGAEWACIADVCGNYQRRRVHDVVPRAVDTLRITITATNGSRSARIVEVRAYGVTDSERQQYAGFATEGQFCS